MPRAWLRNLEKFPRSTVVAAGVGGAICASLLVMFSIHKPLPVPTMTKEWREASKEYIKFQKLNPIAGKECLLH